MLLSSIKFPYFRFSIKLLNVSKTYPKELTLLKFVATDVIIIRKKIKCYFASIKTRVKFEPAIC